MVATKAFAGMAAADANAIAQDAKNASVTTQQQIAINAVNAQTTAINAANSNSAHGLGGGTNIGGGHSGCGFSY